ncbi:MAG: O-antigen ligase family protein [Kiritimatiellae bacterium]|nr:O-antigen ligase family protein [Kiritimatiellia bacterium]MDW8458740.1 O-antigen ligase family protein [Verrucomicrobiota bacterium]
MSSGYLAASSEPEAGPSPKRRRRSPLPRSRSIYEWAALALVGLCPIAGIWLYGAIPLWAYGPMMALAFVGCALYWARPLFFDRAEPAQCPPAFGGLALFLAYGALLILRSEARYEAFLEMLKLACHVFAFQFWFGLAREQGRWRILLALLLLSGTLMAWYAIVQHANGSRMVLLVERPAQYEMRASGAFICPNHFANFLAMLVPTSIALMTARGAGAALRILAVYSAVVLLPPIYLSASRSAWIGLGAGITVTLALLGLRKSRSRAIVLLLVTPLALAAVGVAVWAFSPLVQERVADALRGNVRLNLWRDTWTMIRDNPWFGWGPGQYRWIYPQYWHFLKMHIDPEHAHNDYLQLVAEFGAVGAVLLLSALAWALIRLVAVIQNSDSERGAALIAGFAGACAASAAHAMFDYNFHLFGNVQVLAALGGVTCATLVGGGHLRPRPCIGSGKISALAAAVVMLAFAVLSARASAAEIFTARGDRNRQKARFESAVAAYRAALRVEPRKGAAHRGIGLVRIAQARWNLDAESRTRQLDEAIERFERALKLNPRDLDAQFGLVRVAQMRERADEALARLRDLVRQAPYHSGYWFELGLHLRSMRDYAGALQAFETARSLEPSERIDLNIQAVRRRLAESQKSP